MTNKIILQKLIFVALLNILAARCSKKPSIFDAIIIPLHFIVKQFICSQMNV
jgi:hypothetical protein